MIGWLLGFVVKGSIVCAINQSVNEQLACSVSQQFQVIAIETSCARVLALRIPVNHNCHGNDTQLYSRSSTQVPTHILTHPYHESLTEAFVRDAREKLKRQRKLIISPLRLTGQEREKVEAIPSSEASNLL